MVALVGLLGDELVGVASYEPVGDGAAEVALAVADGMHRRGVATLLVEHLVSLARAHGVTALTAEVLAEQLRRAARVDRLGARDAAQVERWRGRAIHAGAASCCPG